MTFAIIPAGEAIPPCLDAGWSAPDLVIPERELVEIPAAAAEALQQVYPLLGVVISAESFPARGIRVHHGRPAVTTLGTAP